MTQVNATAQILTPVFLYVTGVTGQPLTHWQMYSSQWEKKIHWSTHYSAKVTQKRQNWNEFSSIWNNCRFCSKLVGWCAYVYLLLFILPLPLLCANTRLSSVGVLSRKPRGNKRKKEVIRGKKSYIVYSLFSRTSRDTVPHYLYKEELNGTLYPFQGIIPCQGQNWMLQNITPTSSSLNSNDMHQHFSNRGCLTNALLTIALLQLLHIRISKSEFQLKTFPIATSPGSRHSLRRCLAPLGHRILLTMAFFQFYFADHLIKACGKKK